ncbi:arginine repressor, partial [Dysosmobacter welbionis]
LGEHDAQEILQALPVVVGGVNMDMDAAGVVDLASGMAHLPHTFLKFRQLRIGQFGGNHLHPVVPVSSSRITVRCLLFPADTGIAHQFPLFVFCVPDDPGIVRAASMKRQGSKVSRQGCGGLLPCNAGELHLHAEALILHIDHAASSRHNA